MDLMILLWIALTNAFTNGITGLIIGLFMYYYGKKQGEKSKDILKAEIKTYIQDDLLDDLKDSIGNQVKGVFGPFAKSVNGEMPEVAREWAQANPGMMQLLMNVGKGAVITKMAKTLGVPKEVRDALKGYSMNLMTGGSPDPEPMVQGPNVVLPTNMGPQGQQKFIETMKKLNKM